MTENLVQGVFSFLAFACLVCLLFTAWQSMVVDTVRQRIFEIRDDAFIWAVDNKRLNDDAYLEFREMANSSIRHFENTSLLKIFILNKLFNIQERADKVHPAFLQEAHLRKEFQKLIKISSIGVFIRSPLGIVLAFILLPLLLLGFLLDTKSSMPERASRPDRVVHSLSREVEADLLISAAI